MIDGLNKRLQEARKTKHLSQQHVADYLGTNRETISSYETKDVTPVPEALMKMAVLYDVSVDYLLGIERTRALFTDGLTDTQISSLQTVANEFKATNNQNR